MRKSLRVLLEGIIDYAGLFPPAKLPLPDAIRNYAAYKKHEDHWMMSRFIVPVSQLDTLISYHDFFSETGPFHFSVTGSGGSNTKEFLSNLEQDVEKIKQFHDGRGSIVKIPFYETRLPSDVLSDQSGRNLQSLFNKSADIIEKFSNDNVTVFYESILNNQYRDWNGRVIAALKKHNDELSVRGFKKYQKAGYKLRCGGLTADMFPSSERVAYIIKEVLNHDLAMKFTAGLHHPYRHYDATIPAKMHGFINVFTAVVMAKAHNLNEARLQRILEDENQRHFTFDDEQMSWNDLSATVFQVESTRDYLISYGSCSFDEPREDLTALGLMP